MTDEEWEAWFTVVETGQVRPNVDVNHLRKILHVLDMEVLGAHHQATVVGPITQMVLRDLQAQRVRTATDHPLVEAAHNHYEQQMDFVAGQAFE